MISRGIVVKKIHSTISIAVVDMLTKLSQQVRRELASMREIGFSSSLIRVRFFAALRAIIRCATTAKTDKTSQAGLTRADVRATEVPRKGV